MVAHVENTIITAGINKQYVIALATSESNRWKHCKTELLWYTELTLNVRAHVELRRDYLRFSRTVQEYWNHFKNFNDQYINKSYNE